MLEGALAFCWAQILAIKPAFVSKTPHFNFISVHCKRILSFVLQPIPHTYTASPRGD